MQDAREANDEDAQKRAFDPDSLTHRDARAIARALPFARALVRRYVRLQVHGSEHVPPGPALFVSNHNGGIAGPDVLCTLVALWDARGPEAPLFALAHDFAMRQFTPLGRFAQRFGALRASAENADRALASGAAVLVYPGGDLEAYRHARRRDEIVLGSRVGFVRAAQRARVPIVPIVAHGAHRSGYIFHEGAWLARVVGMPRWGRVTRFPLALALPWGLALGPYVPYLPLPFPIQLQVLPPVHLGTDADPHAVQATLLQTMQAALDDLASRARGARRGRV